MSLKVQKTIKYAILFVLVACAIYFLYAMTSCIIMWNNQPVFISADTTSRSRGFLIQSAFYMVFLLITLAATALYTLLVLRKANNKKPQQNS